eukprot:scaffold450_cov139-Skeletonema_menzelii.AAC.5
MNDTNNSSSPAKKCKANDGRATTDCEHDVNGNANDGGGFLSSWFGYFSGRRYGGASSGPPGYDTSIHQSLSQMNATMMRMEEKLASVNSIERRCEQLEAKCSSLENLLESTSKATKKHIDEKIDGKCDSLANRLEAKVEEVHKQVERSLKLHEYNEMLIKNQSWEYSAALPSMDHLVHDGGYTADEVAYLTETAEELKDLTTKMRRGEFPHDWNGNLKGIYMETSDSGDPPFNYAVNTELLPHWNEFAAALKQFTPVIKLLPDNCESCFSLDYVQLNPNAMLLIKDALMGMPFKKLDFTNNNNGDGARGGMSVDAILDVVESNKHLRKLVIWKNQIGSQHIERLCSAVRNHPLVELDLDNSFEPGIGDEMLASLLTIDDLKLEKLGMSSNHITSVGITLLSDFLATNPRLKELDLSENNLTDSDAELIANALRSNTTLRVLGLFHNNTTDAGDEALHLVRYDGNSLNAVADSNHICSVKVGWTPLDYWNLHKDEQVNRGMKIYHLLSLRNKMMSNAKHFDDIDVKILPDMLGAVQKYQIDASVYTDKHYIRHDSRVNPLSIVYEVMRRWDKVTPLYKTLGKSV